MILMAVVFLGQGKRRCKGHLFKCRTLKRNFVQRGLVKLDTDEGLPVKTNPSQIAIIEFNALKIQFSKIVVLRSVLVSLTSISFTSMNFAPCPDVLRVVRTRMDLRNLAFVRSVTEKLQSVRFAPSKLASRASMTSNELLVKSALLKSKPRSLLTENFALCAVTPAKSLCCRFETTMRNY
jgi:hypothetical protein